MAEYQVDLKTERERSRAKLDAQLLVARARSLLYGQWDATEEQLQEAIAKRYPKDSPEKAGRVLAEALRVQREERRSLSVESFTPAAPEPEEKAVQQVRNWEAATFEGLAADLPPSKRRKRRMPRKKASEVMPAVKGPLVEVKDLRKITPEQRKQIDVLTRRMMAEYEWLTPTPLMGMLRKKGFAVSRSCAIYLLRHLREAVDAGDVPPEPEAPAEMDPRVPPPAIDTSVEVVEAPTSMEAESTSSHSLAVIAGAPVLEMTLSLEQNGLRAFATIRAHGSQDMDGVLNRLPYLVPSIRDLLAAASA